MLEFADLLLIAFDASLRRSRDTSRFSSKWLLRVLQRCLTTFSSHSYGVRAGGLGA